MPANAYTQHQNSWPAFSMLFDSGNQPAPLGFGGQTDFEKFVNSEDFRAALSLRDVKLCCDGQGNPQSVTYRPYGEVGYTPMRTEVNWMLLNDPKVTLWHSKGVGSTGSKVTFQNNCATISCWVYFKIGGVGNLGSWILTGQWAPFAWIQTDYTICCDGSITVKFYGTDIPTQYYYIDWSRIGLHDMLADTTNQIDGFLKGGDCKAAPGGLKRTWTGKGVRCQ